LHDLEDAYRDVYDAAMAAVDAALELRATDMEGPDYGDVDASTSSSGGSSAGLGTVNYTPATSNRSGTNF
jgi:hypothetical protein